MAPHPRALVFGRSVALVPRVTAFLGRVGFKVTLATPKPELLRSKGVARAVLVKRPGRLALQAHKMLRNGYDLVVPADDNALLLARRLDLPAAEKLRLLPVSSERGLDHVASKVELSRTLSQAGITTPPFAVALEASELAAALAATGYPAMVKSDYGSGGQDVVRVTSPAEAARATAHLRYPVLVQKFVDGRLIDCSGFFRNGEPVTFSHSTILTAVAGGGGPSSVRRYRTRAERDEGLAAELRRLGHALDANGFVSISAIHSNDDGRLYFFEADMRPNVWVEYPKFFGADPAVAIANAFGLPLLRQTWPGTTAEEVELAFLPRLGLLDVVFNRYKCRTFFEDPLDRGMARSWLDNWVTEHRVMERIEPARDFLAKLRSSRRAA